MSWQDRIENTVFTIRTGDGQLFTPLWKNGETSKEYNAATFEFINVPGAYINRKQVRARKFPLTFWFQGEDNIDQADAFDNSANDPRAWTVRHPFYGDITGQPISISRNDMQYNCTEITVDFWESTLGYQGVAYQIAITDVIAQNIASFQTISPIDYSSKVNLKPADETQVQDFAQKTDAIITKGLDADQYTSYQAAKTQMFTDLDNFITNTQDTITSISSMQAVIMQPATFSTALTARINMIAAIYQSVATMLSLLANVNNKAFFETQGGMIIGTMATALVNPINGDYITRDQVTTASINLVNMYNDYLTTLDNSYVAIGDPNNSYTASQQTQNSLQDIVLQTLTGLETLAFNAKVERLVTLNTDSNIILLTHKYMGLDINDANIELFRTINNLKNNYLFIVEKGTQIKYYA